MFIDMHIHTNASDGVYSIEDVIEKVRENNVKYFSICDHDSIENSKKALSYLKKNNIEDLNFIPGVELTTTYKGKEMHILFYSYDIEDDDVKMICEAGLKERRRANEAFITSIEDEYKDIISLEEFKNYEYDKKKGGFKIINYLMEKGIVDRDSFFYPEWRNRWDIQNFIQSEEVIKRLKNKKGKIILAHPSYYFRDGVMPKEDLDNFKSYGIDGIECFSPYCKNEFFNYYVDYCNQNNLLVTVGSDSHGSFTKGREIGKPNVEVNKSEIQNTIKTIYKQ